MLLSLLTFYLYENLEDDLVFCSNNDTINTEALPVPRVDDDTFNTEELQVPSINNDIFNTEELPVPALRTLLAEQVNLALLRFIPFLEGKLLCNSKYPSEYLG